MKPWVKVAEEKVFDAKALDVMLDVVVLMVFAAPVVRNTIVCKSIMMMMFKRTTAISFLFFFLESGRLVLMICWKIAMTVKRDV